MLYNKLITIHSDLAGTQAIAANKQKHNNNKQVKTCKKYNKQFQNQLNCFGEKLSRIRGTCNYRFTKAGRHSHKNYIIRQKNK